MTKDNGDKPLLKFSWLDVPMSIWYFLGEDKKKWVVFNTILFSVFFYKLVPPLVVGRIIDFLTKYEKGQSLNTFYYYARRNGRSAEVCF